MENRKTLIVNLFGGPCAGKSITAAGVFHKLKTLHYNTEIVSEYAKELHWIEDFNTLKCQIYVTAEQIFRTYRLCGKVDVIITDSPIMLGAYYAEVYPGAFGVTDNWQKWLLEIFNSDSWENLNIFIERNDNFEYIQAGRYQDENGAKQADIGIEEILTRKGVHFEKKLAGDSLVDEIVSMIENKIK